MPPVRRERTNVDFSVLAKLPTRASTQSDVVLRTLKEYDVFADLDNKVLDAAVSRGHLAVFELERDQLLPLNNKEHLFFVCYGQVAIGVFDQEAVDARRRHQEELEKDDDPSLLPLLPLARVAKKNVARFGPGDVFNTAALETTEQQDLAFFSLTPVTVVSFERDTLAEFTASSSTLTKALGDSISKSRGLYQDMAGVKQEIFDFYLRHGLSASSRRMGHSGNASRAADAPHATGPPWSELSAT